MGFESTQVTEVRNQCLKIIFKDLFSDKKWYQKTGWIIALLIFFFPVGLFLMRKYTDWKKPIKWIVTALILICAFIGIAFPDNLESINLKANSKEAYDINQNVKITVATTPSDYELSNDDFQCSGGNLSYSNGKLSFSASKAGLYSVWAEHNGIKSNTLSFKIEDKAVIAKKEQEKKAEEERIATEKAKQEEQERLASDAGFRSAYNNCKSLHDKSFRSLVTADLQKAVDDCPLKHATLEKIIVLFNQMYTYADANDLCDKKYSDYVKIKSEDDDEKGVPFENDELEILWKNQEDPVVEMLLIICYSGFRISEYIDLEINWNENYLKGGLKTDAGRNRIVPIHSAILPLVKRRIKRDGAFLTCSTGDFRTDMYATLEKLGIKKHTPHDCRHTFSKLCDDYYANETDKKLMLGHSFQDVTNKVYLHRSLERLKEEIERIKVCR